MIVFYLEASAFVNRYLSEQGSEVLDALLDASPLRACPIEFGTSRIPSYLQISALLPVALCHIHDDNMLVNYDF